MMRKTKPPLWVRLKWWWVERGREEVAVDYDYTITTGMRIVVGGWGPMRARVGDFGILRHRGRGKGSRYIVTKVDYPGDPPDQWFLTGKFFSRRGW